MDPFFAFAAIVGLLSTSIGMIEYIDGVRNAPKDLLALRANLRQAQTSLEQLRGFLAQNAYPHGSFIDSWPEKTQDLVINHGVIDSYKEQLRGLKTKLENRNGMKKWIQYVHWPKTKNAVKDMSDRIQRLQGNIVLALQMDNA